MLSDPESWHVVERGETYSTQRCPVWSDGDPSERWEGENVHRTHRKVDNEEKVKIQVAVHFRSFIIYILFIDLDQIH